MGPNGLYMTVRTCLTQLQPEDPWSFCSCSYVLDAPLCQSNHKTQVIWKRRGTSYAIFQHSPSCVRAVAIGAACSRSGAAVPAGPADASEGGIRAAENYVAGRIEPKTSALIPC
jgi:hypothetical protein